MEIKKVASARLLAACRRFLENDPPSNVLILGDLYLPLFGVSDIYCALANGEIVGVCTIYHAFAIPSLTVNATTTMAKEALIQKALTEIRSDFISLCPPEDVDLLKNHSTVLEFRPEHQMITESPTRVKRDGIRAYRVRKKELEALDRFYIEHHAEAWVPIQFETGPYFCVKDDNRIVSAAGVHLVAPQIAQLGNIVTDEAYINCGFGTVCTAALVSSLARKGRIVSLFVRIGNAPAIHMYEKLGFVKVRDIAFLVMRKNPSSQSSTRF
ncbi:GNAT family N-acetyltransferase [Candidatus Bathyarchaeota archaeon]|nr:GNAT family N-acetyltransferase [Candidatus Bathyarchaeota archaeon]